MTARHVVVINPGSTSTKIGLYTDSKEVERCAITHDTSALPCIMDQFDLRKKAIEEFLQRHPLPLSLVMARGGLLHPLPSGIYEVNDTMCDDLKNETYGSHASNLGALLARDLARKHNCNACIADPVVVDERIPEARISGHPLFPRKSIFHALNQKAVARRWARDNGTLYEEKNLVIAHMGGGVSVGAHRKGLVIDVNDALRGEGSFSPERSGTLAALSIVDAAFSGAYSKDELKKMITGEGGFFAHTGTADIREIIEGAERDDSVHLLLQAFIHQVSKEIGAMASVLRGDVDAIILTGGIAHAKMITQGITEKVSWIANVDIYPGEDELDALAEAALRLLRGEVASKHYR